MGSLSVTYENIGKAPAISELTSNSLAISKQDSTANIEYFGGQNYSYIQFVNPSNRKLNLFQDGYDTPTYNFLLTYENSGEFILPNYQDFLLQTIKLLVVSQNDNNPWFVRPDDYPDILDGEFYMDGRSLIQLQVGCTYEFTSTQTFGWLSNVVDKNVMTTLMLDSTEDTYMSPLRIERNHLNKFIRTAAVESGDTFIKLVNNTFPIGGSFNLCSLSDNNVSIRLDVMDILNYGFYINGKLAQNNYMVFENGKQAKITRISTDDWLVEGEFTWSSN